MKIGMAKVPEGYKILWLFSNILLANADLKKQVVKEAKWLFNPEISSQSEGYSSHWLIWLVRGNPWLAPLYTYM